MSEDSPDSSIDDASTAVDALSTALEQGAEDLPRVDVDLAVIDEPLPEYRQPWDQREDEDKDSYHYFLFLIYRDMGLSRSLRAVHNHLLEHPETIPLRKGQGKVAKGGTSYNNVTVISRRFDWKDRVLAWDNEQERLYQLARSEAIREMVDRHEGQIERAIDGLMAPIDALNRAMEEDDEFLDSLSKTDKRKLISLANQAARTIPSLMSAERLARGMPTEIVSGQVDHQHTVAVERNQIGEILDILAGAGQLNVGGGSLGAGEVVDAEVVDVHPLSTEDND